MVDWEPGTKADLVADAKKLGITVTERMVTDWCERGLLDVPERRGAGRGRGSQRALFNPNQRRLFTELLQIRQRQPTIHIAQLALFPLYLWGYWGDEYTPTRQAKLALRTWVLGAYNRTKKSARASAIASVDLIIGPGAESRERTRLTALFEQFVGTGEIGDPAELDELMDVVMDPEGTGRRIGPAGLTVDHRALLRYILMRDAASHRAAELKVSDNTMDAARVELKRSVDHYLYRQPALIAYLGPDAYQQHAMALDKNTLLNSVGIELLLAIAAIDDLVPWPATWPAPEPLQPLTFWP